MSDPRPRDSEASRHRSETLCPRSSAIGDTVVCDVGKGGATVGPPPTMSKGVPTPPAPSLPLPPSLRDDSSVRNGTLHVSWTGRGVGSTGSGRRRRDETSELMNVVFVSFQRSLDLSVRDLFVPSLRLFL